MPTTSTSASAGRWTLTPVETTIDPIAWSENYMNVLHDVCGNFTDYLNANKIDRDTLKSWLSSQFATRPGPLSDPNAVAALEHLMRVERIRHNVLFLDRSIRLGTRGDEPVNLSWETFAPDFTRGDDRHGLQMLLSPWLTKLGTRREFPRVENWLRAVDAYTPISPLVRSRSHEILCEVTRLAGELLDAAPPTLYLWGYSLRDSAIGTPGAAAGSAAAAIYPAADVGERPGHVIVAAPGHAGDGLMSFSNGHRAAVSADLAGPILDELLAVTAQLIRDQPSYRFEDVVDDALAVVV